MANSKELRQTTGAAGRHFMENNFSLQQYQTGIVNTVDHITGGITKI